MKQTKNYEVEYGINHEKEYQNQKQHFFYVYDGIRKMFWENDEDIANTYMPKSSLTNL